MKKTWKSLRSLASRAVNNIFGVGNAFLGSWAAMLGGSNENWHDKAGARYDNSAVWSACEYLRRQITGDPRLIVQRAVVKGEKTEWNELPSHGLPEAIENGPLFTSDQLFAGAIISLVVTGNAYWLKVRSGTRVIGYAYIPHWQIEPKNDRSMPGRPADGSHPITYYEFTNPNGQPCPLAVEEIVHFRWGADPARPGMGISPIHASLREVVTDNEASTLGAALLANAGIPGLWISPKQEVGKLNPAQAQDFKETVARKITGDMAGTPLTAPFPADLQVIGFSPDKLVLGATRSLAAARILSPLGIDPMALGLPSENKTYSNYEEANRDAWRTACKPLLRLFARTLKQQALADFARIGFGSSDRIRVWWDLSEVPEEQKNVIEERKSLNQLWVSDAITRSVLKTALGWDTDGEDETYFTPFRSQFAPKTDLKNQDAKADDNDKKAAERMIALRVKQKALEDVG